MNGRVKKEKLNYKFKTKCLQKKLKYDVCWMFCRKMYLKIAHFKLIKTSTPGKYIIEAVSFRIKEFFSSNKLNVKV